MLETTLVLENLGLNIYGECEDPATKSETGHASRVNRALRLRWEGSENGDEVSLGNQLENRSALMM